MQNVIFSPYNSHQIFVAYSDGSYGYNCPPQWHAAIADVIRGPQNSLGSAAVAQQQQAMIWQQQAVLNAQIRATMLAELSAQSMTRMAQSLSG